MIGNAQNIAAISINSQIAANESSYIEDHIHRKSRVFGKSADQSGNNWATEDRLTPFRAISGNGDYGADANDEAKVFGSSDIPISGQTKFDPGEITVVGVNSDTEYIIRMVWGIGTMADAITAGQYSSKVVKFDSINPNVTSNVIIKIGTPRLAAGTKVWLQCKNATNNAYVDFYLDAHGYNS
jgi:hypothetical protein